MQEALESLVAGGTFYQWLGIVGVGFYISSYLLLQVGLLRGASYTYTSMNLVGASLVLLSLMSAFNLASAIIQATWIVISIFGLARIYVLRNMIRFDPDEARMVDDVLKEMPPYLAKRLLKRGRWRDALPGEVLTREGAPVTTLFYLLDGAAGVALSGRSLATVTSGFIGEMNVLHSRPATASVTVTAPSRVFEIDGGALRAMAAKDTEFRAFLELHLSESTRAKLVASNRQA